MIKHITVLTHSHTFCTSIHLKIHTCSTSTHVHSNNSFLSACYSPVKSHPPFHINNYTHSHKHLTPSLSHSLTIEPIWMPCTHRHTLAPLFSAKRWPTDQVRVRMLTPCSSSCSTLGPPYHSPPPCPWGEYSVGWMAPDRGLRGWNVSLALQGSDPPEHWSTAQSLLINHCRGCPGPGPNTALSPAPFLSLFLTLSPRFSP